MSLLFSLPPFLPKPISKTTINKTPSIPTPTAKFPYLNSVVKSPPIQNQPRKTLTPFSSFTASETTDFTIDLTQDSEEDFLADSPWEGAVVYKRDASVLHVEYSTTLERLGLGNLSTGVSKSRASAMGIRLPLKRAKELGSGGIETTPVLVSVDVTRRKRRLKLDGIVRTVITLGCNRCAEPAAECVFSNFSLLLTEDPIEESDDEINMGVIYGEDKLKSSTSRRTEEEEDEKQIDLDDRLYFPSEVKEIDISKHIRDIVHIEITINAICDPSCKGLCLKCGMNLNKSSCNCSREEIENKQSGPLQILRKQRQQR